MVRTIELHLEERVLDRVRRLARARHCTIEDVFTDAIERVPVAAAQEDPILGMFKDEPQLVDEMARAAMEARERHPLRSGRE
jgi:hypothetical protein